MRARRLGDRHPSAWAIGLLVMLLVAACSSSGEDDVELLFGDHDGECASVVLTNDDGDAELVADLVDCLFDEIVAQRPLIVDALTVTVEGDAIPVRYDVTFVDDDAEPRVTITTDNRRDTYGNSGVVTDRCVGLQRVPTGWLPEGGECVPVSGPGFADAGHPSLAR